MPFEAEADPGYEGVRRRASKQPALDDFDAHEVAPDDADTKTKKLPGSGTKPSGAAAA